MRGSVSTHVRRRAMIGSTRIARKGRNHGCRDARNRKHDTSADKRQRIGCRHAIQLRLDETRA
jgi:hypothetical protein